MTKREKEVEALKKDLEKRMKRDNVLRPTTTNLKVGNIVYVRDPFNNDILEATIMDEPYMNKDTKTMVYKVHMSYIVNKQGRKIMTYGADSVREAKDIFATAIDVYNHIKNEETVRYNNFMDNIKTIKDLMEFPLLHSFGEGNEDISAVQAYKDKTKELLNIDID